jgi:hypothetical protein
LSFAESDRGLTDIHSCINTPELQVKLARISGVLEQAVCIPPLPPQLCGHGNEPGPSGPRKPGAFLPVPGKAHFIGLLLKLLLKSLKDRSTVLWACHIHGYAICDNNNNKEEVGRDTL